MADKEKNAREFDFEVEQKGKNVKRAFKLTEVSLNQQNEATKVYNRAFRDALESGALLRNKLEDHMREQGMWDDAKQKQLEDVQRTILEHEKKLAKGGIRLKVARDLALEMGDKRNEMRSILMQRNSLDGNTAEGQADNARFDYLVSASLVYSDSGKPYFKDLADYRNRSTEPVAIEAARRLAQLVYGLDSNYEKNLPENKFLSDFDFIDNELRLINKEGQYVDREGNLVNEDGRFVDEDGNLVDKEGNPVTEAGEYKFERAPFLDDDGNPIVAEQPEAEEETEEPESEDEEEATEEAETESKQKTEA